jgi:gluconate kinase
LASGLARLDRHPLHRRRHGCIRQAKYRQDVGRASPLTDDDRWPWLEAVGDTLARHADRPDDHRLFRAQAQLSRHAIRHHRAGAPVCFVHLSGSRELIGQRMQAAHGPLHAAVTARQPVRRT